MTWWAGGGGVPSCATGVLFDPHTAAQQRIYAIVFLIENLRNPHDIPVPISLAKVGKLKSDQAIHVLQGKILSQCQLA